MKHDSDILKRIKSYFMRRKSAQEAHAFEREAEGDNFLYEAMEGFEDMLTSDIQQAMDELDDRLDQKTRGGLLVFNWRIAASIAAVIGVSGLLLMIVFNQEEHAETEVANEAASDEHYTPRSNKADYDSLGDYSWAMQEDSASSDSALAVSNASYAIADQEQAPQGVPSPPNEPALRTEEPTRKRESTAETTQVELADATEDDEAMFDSQEIAAVEAPSESIESEIAMEKSNSESVSQAMRSVASESKTLTKAEEPQPKSVQPKGGMAAYQNYLKKNIQTSEGMPKGSVVVTFELDRSGKPKKLEVSKSLCTACDAEAKRLIENGPEWESEDRKDRVSVTVEFE